MLYFGKSDTGRKRTTNQDRFDAIELRKDILISVVCDGMGGAAGGNIAAETAIEVFCGYISRSMPRIEQALSALSDLSEADVSGEGVKSVMVEAAAEANKAVYDMAHGNAELTGMGTTLVSALVYGSTAYVINIGDSRFYTVGNSGIKKITRDHSFVQYLVDMGQLTPEEAAKSPHRNVITRAVGSDKTVEADTYTVPLSDDETCYVFLCTDGLTNFVSAGEIHRVLVTGGCEEDITCLETKVTTLIDLANEAGGGDNITALVIKT
ncbi:MAG: Stp1/IreP family PP2C-type Ser/Thr phosphatase [Eubacteriales bacterium]|jgi:serine/threonine protein phosphatase PrpC|nr:Stp1/IreP family PP2C-type Ser/Thr phosphatase [Eubacteriales bacterium]